MTLRSVFTALTGVEIEPREATLANPPEWLVMALGGGTTSFANQTVTPATATTLVPVWSAVSLLAGAVATLPLVVYREVEKDVGGRQVEIRERARDTRQWEILHDQPNEEMAADELWELVMVHLLLWGNAFVAKVPGGDGRVAELWPIRPERCQVGRIRGEKVITVDGRPYSERDILHIRGLGENGLIGLSPVQKARQMLGAGLAHQEFTGRFWANGTMVNGVLEHPNELTDTALTRLARTWRRRWSGVGNAGLVPILEEGMKYREIAMPLKDAQFIEQAKFGDLRVAQMFRVPPYMLGAEIGSSLTYSTTESQGIDFVRYSLARWLRRIEMSVRRDPEIMPPSLGLFGEFLVDALLRADTKTRYQTYRLGILNRFLYPNEARLAENREPYEEGWEFPELPQDAGDEKDDKDSDPGEGTGER